MTLISQRHSVLEGAHFAAENSLTSAQLQLDSLAQSSASTITDGASIASMMVGGLAGRLFKSVLFPFTSLTLRPLAQVAALFGEASAFELTHRSFRSMQGENSNTLFSLRGEGALGSGILHSFVSFATLKLAGAATQSSNLWWQHASQSAAFVAGHDLAAGLGLQEADSGSLFERLIRAEWMNVQLGISTHLTRQLLPSLHTLERGLDSRNAFTAQSRKFSRFQERTMRPRMAALEMANSQLENLRRVTITQEISAANLESLLQEAQGAYGAHLKISPATLHSTEAYAPVIELWAALLPKAHRYASLSLEISNVVFRYGELSGEWDATRPEPARGERGTIIDLSHPKATFAQMTEILLAYRLHASPQWRATHNSEVLPGVRTDFPESMGRVVRSAVYDHYADLRRWVHGVSDELLAMDAHLKAGKSLDAAQKARVESLSQDYNRRQSRFVDYRSLWRWAAESRIRRPSEIYEGPTVLSVLHDMNNRISKLMTLQLEFYSIQHGTPLNDSILEAMNESVHVTVSSAVNEGLMIARLMAERAGLEIQFPSGLPDRFQHVLLREDIHLELALMDVIGNLTSNPARYHNPALPASERYEKLKVHFLANGALEVTVSDNGIGILPENFDRLGEVGFQEKRKHIEGSEGNGLCSVVQILRERGWGPLWVKSTPGRGSEFRFVIPAKDFEVAPHFRENAERDLNSVYPGDTLSYLERNLLEGFLVPAASMDMAIRQLLEQIPGPRVDGTGVDFEHWDRILDGSYRPRRLAALHRLLSGSAGPEGSIAVDNAHGTFADLFLSLSKMGSHVWLKEPDLDASAWNFIGVMDLAPEIAQRIHPTSSIEEMNRALDQAARVSYWTNPNYAHFSLPKGKTFPEYLGRDVGLGGYLVIQNGRGVFDINTRSFPFNPVQWQLVYQSDRAFNSELGDERVIPTSSSSPNAVFIYRRIQ